ncbi:MAG TPA: class I SAM-dependent methyltransferase [Chthoniobacterales bacterium]|nr:class I SAM-dependent methyltransferase [Chthoniobacterales bacterium]
MPHSVSDHLHVMIADYDRFIRTVIPHYETMRAVQLDLLARCLPPDGRVLDLGGGTGALARAVAEKFSGVRVEIWDTDPAMMEVARERCAAFGDRVHFVERSFAEPLPACDAVVACIALHHVKDMPSKGKIYGNIFRALRPGGIFANADCVMSETPAVRNASYEAWAKFIEGQGLSPAEAQHQFAQWAKEDYYPPLATELRLLAAAGFAEPDCFWRTAPFTVFGGVRS